MNTSNKMHGLKRVDDSALLLEFSSIHADVALREEQVPHIRPRLWSFIVCRITTSDLDLREAHVLIYRSAHLYDAEFKNKDCAIVYEFDAVLICLQCSVLTLSTLYKFKA